MKKLLTTVIAMLFISSGLFAQGLPNAGFENWSTTSLYENPDGWATFNFQSYFSGLGVSASKSSDAVSNNYSVLLQKFSDGVNTVPGFISRSQSINYQPDSIVGYVKYDILPGDSGNILVGTLSGGIQNGFTTASFTGSDTAWHYFSYPIVYFGLGAPDSVAVVLDAGTFNLATSGSWMQFDNVHFSNSGAGGTNLFNGDFESWTLYSYSDPDNWHSVNLYTTLSGVTNCVQSSDAHSGTSAALLQTVPFNLGAPDTLSLLENGVFGPTGPQGGFPYDSMPTHLKGYYKYLPSGNDTAVVVVEFTLYDGINDTTITINFAAQFLQAANSYTQFDVPINWNGIPFPPDTANIVFSSSEAFTNNWHVGSQLFIDDLQFTFEGPAQNMPPNAVNDNATTTQDSSVNIAVLANDNDPNGDPLMPIVTIGAQHGNTVVELNGSISYTPDAGFFGSDSLQYNACDNGVPPLCDAAMVYITVDQDTSNDTTSIALLNQPELHIYPNPATDVLNFSIPQNRGAGVDVVVMDVTGRVILHQSILATRETMSLDVTNLDSGMYLMQITSGENHWLNKVVIQ